VRLAAQLGTAPTLLLLIAGNLTSAILIWAHIYAQDIGNGLWSVYGLLGLATVAACVVYQILSTISYGWAVVSPGAGVVYLRGGSGRIGLRLLLAAAPPGRPLILVS
jgi:hypothetical protein